MLHGKQTMPSILNACDSYLPFPLLLMNFMLVLVQQHFYDNVTYFTLRNIGESVSNVFKFHRT